MSDISNPPIISGTSLIDLNQVITDLTNAGTLNQTIVVDKMCGLSSNLKIDESTNLELEVVQQGSINLRGYKFEIFVSFRAGMFQVFEFTTTDLSSAIAGLTSQLTLATENVIFGKRSIEKVQAIWFGTKPDYGTTNTDNHPPLQRAITAAMNVRKLFITAGSYLIKDTLCISKPFIKGNFAGILLEGVLGQDGNETRLYLDSSVTDRPAINIQLVRKTTIKKLTIVGANSQPENTIYPNGGSLPDTFPTDPVEYILKDSSTSLPKFSYGTHNPYCAIATDAYLGTKQTSAYPENYSKGRKYVSADSANSISGSAWILIEDVNIEKFVAGIVICPNSPSVVQNDGIVIQRSLIQNCVYGIALGTAQARATHIKECSIAKTYAAIDNFTFGENQTADMNSSSNQFGANRIIYNLERGSGQCHISGDYSEATCRVGNFGTLAHSSVASRVLISGGEYIFSVQNYNSMHLISTQRNVVFDGCTFGFTTDTFDVFCSPSEQSSGKVTFRSCNFHTSSANKYPAVFTTRYTEKSHIRFEDCTLKLSGSVKQVLSDDMVVTNFEKTDPYFVNKVSEPTRIPLHVNAQSLRVRARSFDPQTIDRDKTYNLEYTSSLLPYITISAVPTASIVTDTTTPTNNKQELMFTLNETGSLVENDRVFWPTVIEEASIPSIKSCFLPILEPKTIQSAGLITTLEVNPNYVQQKDQEFEIYNPQAPQAGTSGPPYTTRLTILPCTDFSDLGKGNNPGKRSTVGSTNEFAKYYKSNIFTIINENAANDLKGDFTSGSNSITNVKGVHLFEVGDFINGNFAPMGTRITKVEYSTRSASTASVFHSTGTITMSKNANATGRGYVHSITVK